MKLKLSGSHVLSLRGSEFAPGGAGSEVDHRTGDEYQRQLAPTQSRSGLGRAAPWTQPFSSTKDRYEVVPTLARWWPVSRRCTRHLRRQLLAGAPPQPHPRTRTVTERAPTPPRLSRRVQGVAARGDRGRGISGAVRTRDGTARPPPWPTPPRGRHEMGCARRLLARMNHHSSSVEGTTAPRSGEYRMGHTMNPETMV